MTEQPLVIDDDRYSRLRLIAWWDQQRLADATVLVVGAGALGNEVIKNLALLGVGRVLIIDFDTIESSNLSRSVLFRDSDCGDSKAEVAARAATDLNADVKFIPMSADVITDIGIGLVRDVDVVIGCLDNREARLWVNRLCWKASTPWVDGGIQEINGVTKVFVPPDGACYECAMTENDYRLINLRYSCPLLKHEDIVAGKVPTAPTISSIIAGLQTQEALKLIHGMPVNDGAALVFNGIANSFYSTQFQHKEDCLSHETYPEPLESGLSSESATVGEMFHLIEEQTEFEPQVLHLDRDLVTHLECRPCDKRLSVQKSMYKMNHSEAACPECGETMKPEMCHTVDVDSPLMEQKLSELGVPAYDILRVETNDRDVHVLLDGDRSKVFNETSS